MSFAFYLASFIRMNQIFEGFMIELRSEILFEVDDVLGFYIFQKFIRKNMNILVLNIAQTIFGS